MVDTPAVEEPFSPDIGPHQSRRQEDLVRPSAPARAAVHHRDVGAVRLLRHAGAADALSDQAFPVFATSQATGLYGGYTALVYLTPLVGGLLADQYLGSKRSVKFGAIVMAIGYFTLAFGGSPAKPYATIDGQRYEVVVDNFVDRPTQRPAARRATSSTTARSCRSAATRTGRSRCSTMATERASGCRRARCERGRRAQSADDRDHADRAVADLGRQRLLQAEHLDHRRHALRQGRSAPRCRLHHLLHGHQPRLDPRAVLLPAARRLVRLVGRPQPRRRRHADQLLR